MNNPGAIFIVTCGAVFVFGTLAVLVGLGLLDDWRWR